MKPGDYVTVIEFAGTVASLHGEPITYPTLRARRGRIEAILTGDRMEVMVDFADLQQLVADWVRGVATKRLEDASDVSVLVGHLGGLLEDPRNELTSNI